jgi:hypothetical protein
MNYKRHYTIRYASYSAAQYRHTYVQVVTRVLWMGQFASCVAKLQEVCPLEWIM